MLRSSDRKEVRSTTICLSRARSSRTSEGGVPFWVGITGFTEERNADALLAPTA